MKVILKIAESGQDHKRADYFVGLIRSELSFTFVTPDGDDLDIDVASVEVQE